MNKIKIYLILILLIIALSYINKYIFLYSNKAKKVYGKNIYSILIMLLMIFITACRGITVGTDTASYTRIFSTIVSADTLKMAISKAPLTAPVYILICRVLGFITEDPRILIVFCSIFINIGLYVYVRKYSDNGFLSYLSWYGLTLFFYSMNGSRQTMALVIILNILPLIINNIKSIKAWLLLIIAINIHSTAVFIIPGILIVKFLERYKKKNNIFVLSSLIAVGVSFAFTIISKLIIFIIPRYNIYFNGTAQYSILRGTGKGGIIVLYLFLFSIILIWMKNYKALSEDSDMIDKYHEKLLPLINFGIIFGIIYFRNELMNRLLLYYIAIFVSFIPNTVKKYKGKEKVVIELFIILGLIAYSMISLYRGQNGILPYLFYWN